MIETIWYYTGFVFWVALAWLVITFSIWLGAQFLYATWQKGKTYRKVSKLPDFFRDHPECKERFDEWVEKVFR